MKFLELFLRSIAVRVSHLLKMMTVPVLCCSNRAAFYSYHLVSSYCCGMTLCFFLVKFSARTLPLLDLSMCVIGQALHAHSISCARASLYLENFGFAPAEEAGIESKIID